MFQVSIACILHQTWLLYLVLQKICFHIKTKYWGQLIQIKGNVKLLSKRAKECSFFVFLYTKWPFEIYTNSNVKEYSNYEQLKIDIETSEEENIKMIWVLRNYLYLCLKVKQSEGKRRHLLMSYFGIWAAVFKK